MPRIFIPPPLMEVTGGQAAIEIEAATVREAVRRLESQFPGIAARLVHDEKLAPGIVVAIDGVLSSRGIWTELGPASEVHFLPAVSGGESASCS